MNIKFCVLILSLALSFQIFAAGIDENDTTTDNGNAYIVSTVVNAGAGLRSLAQLWNPAGSGKVVYLDRVVVAHGYCAGLSGVDMRFGSVPFGFVFANGSNKNLSIVTQSVAQLRAAHQNAPVTNFPIYEFFPGQCHTTDVIDVVPPIRIPAGMGVHMANGNDNANMPVTFEFREY